MTVKELAKILNATVTEVFEHYKKIFIEIPENEDFVLSIDLVRKAIPNYDSNLEEHSFQNIHIVNSKIEIAETNQENELKFGKIIFWNGIYGFIENKLSKKSIFFRKSSLVNNEKINLLDTVVYDTKESQSEKFAGTFVGCNVKLLAKGNLASEDRYVGTFKKFRQKGGSIESPQIKKHIGFYHSRCYFKNEKIKTNDLVIFCPVKSSKHKDELFCLFAYKLENETDITFLLKQYQDSNIEGIKIHINQLLKSQNIAIEDKFKIELIISEFVDDAQSFYKLKSKLSEYKTLNYIPKYDIIKEHCENTYLIQLFESNIIEEYDVELMKSYFHKTTADNKRFLIRKFSVNDQTYILEYHIEQLRLEGYLVDINDRLKTLLDIIFREKETQQPELYSRIKEEILTDFDFDNIIQLWLNGYLDVPEQYIINNFNFDNEQLIVAILTKKDLKFDETISKIFEEYFLKFKKTDFESEYPNLIKRLSVFENKNRERATEIIAVISTFLSDFQKYTLSVFGVKIEKFDLDSYISNHLNEINDYLKIKYILKSRDLNNNYEKYRPIIESISYLGLISFIESNPWNEILKPSGRIIPEYHTNYFLNDIKDFSDCQDFCKPDIYELACEIFETMPKYNVEHIRLWLNGYVDNEKYDYVGFRTLFKELSLNEQKLFKNKGDIFLKGEVLKDSSLVVKPCVQILEETSTYKIYSARLFNLFFEENRIKIRKEDGSYSNSFSDFLATYAFNNISENSILNNYEIRVKLLLNNDIEEIIGLDNIYQSIHTNQIKKALGIVVNPKNISLKENISYVEDWTLVKKIIEYLDVYKEPDYEVINVAEPKNFFRRLDEESGIDSFEQTALYVHEASCDYAIIWENIDFTDDRATYVFKSRRENIKTQLDKLINSITTLSQLRSTLIRTNVNEELVLFKNNLGFIGKIHKKRGDNLSFEIWQNRLNDLMDKPTPLIPSLETQKMLKDWSPETPNHSPVFKNKSKFESKKVRLITDNEIRTVDIAMKEEGHDFALQENLDNKDIERKHKIYNSLKSFNESLSEILIIK